MKQSKLDKTRNKAVKFLKSKIDVLIYSLIVGGVLKYILATRSFENMIIVAVVMIMLSLRGLHEVIAKNNYRQTGSGGNRHLLQVLPEEKNNKDSR